MRTLLFFDLPMVTSDELRKYRKFLKHIKKLGFYMIQESVYAKMSLDQQGMEATIKKVKLNVPAKGNIMILNITEKQFASIQILAGENKSDVINTDDRVVIL